MHFNQAVVVFDENADEYDAWFDKHPAMFQSELRALERFVPQSGSGLEVGIGSGRFAVALGIEKGVEPAAHMRAKAQSRGIDVVDGTAEQLPFRDEAFDFVLFMTTLCFLDDPTKGLREAFRVLKPSGEIIAGIIDKDSSLGKQYAASDSKYFRGARFIRACDLETWLKNVGFENIQSCQTLRDSANAMSEVQQPISGYGKGGFVVFHGQKPPLQHRKLLRGNSLKSIDH